jgi:hypothetical protein
MNKEPYFQSWCYEQSKMLRAAERAETAGLKLTCYQVNRRLDASKTEYIYDTHVIAPQMKFSGIFTSAKQIDELLAEFLSLQES